MKNFSEYSVDLAADFIEAWEGCRLTAYKCPAGIWTIGVGHTQEVTEHDEITYEQAREGAACRRTSAPPASGQSASVTRRT